MTAPAPRPGPDVAGQLAEAVPFTTVMRFHGPAEVPSRAEREHIAAALLPVVQRLAVEKAAEELREAAKAWQWGAWADTPRHADRIADRIGAAQYVTDWLLARADALTAAAQPTDGGA